jgi:hypothetical protein
MNGTGRGLQYLEVREEASAASLVVENRLDLAGH